MMKFEEYSKNNLIIFDGAMGTNIQNYNLTESDFEGYAGCNEYLNLSKKEIIYEIHTNFLKAGAKVIETNTFGGTRLVLGEYNLEDKIYEINFEGAKTARQAADKFNAYVAGSMGPGTKLPSLGHISYDDLEFMFEEQAVALIEGGVDVFIIETCQDLLQVKAAINGVFSAQNKKRIKLPVMVSVTLEQNGTMLAGSDISSVITTLLSYDLFSIGINCSLGPDMMFEHLQKIRDIYKGRLSCIPNAGLPANINGNFVYAMTPENMADIMYEMVHKFDLDIIGGCCGTSYRHINKIAEKVKDFKPSSKQAVVKMSGYASSLYTSTPICQTPPPALIGERANANGSKAFRELLLKDDFDGMLKVAKDQEAVAHFIDVCTAYAGRKEINDMSLFVSMLNQKLTAPIVIDSTEPDVIETALKRYSGKPVINSINLEDGGQKLHRILNLVKKFPAAVIALTIDEKGMAMTAEKKLQIAEKIYNIWTDEYHLPAGDLIFDPLTFSIGSGDKTLVNAGVETLNGIQSIKSQLKDVKTVLGVSNVSFGLSPKSRVVLNSVFLSRAVQAGLDMAIIHASKVLPLNSLSEEEVRICNELIDGVDGSLNRFIQFFSNKTEKPEKGTVTENLSDEEMLQQKLIKGDSGELAVLLDKLMTSYTPVDIINKILMTAMQKVGELFGSGKMLLPFVLQSAEVMKKSVNYLEQFMDKNDSEIKGKVVLATVKGDVHDIGKNLVDIILTNNGYKVYNLGIKVDVEEMIKKAEEVRADAIGMSGLLVKSTIVMKENIEEIKKKSLHLKVLLGGAALTEGYVKNDCEPILPGNVFYCRDAFSAISVLENKDGLRIQSGKKGREKSTATVKTIPERIDRSEKTEFAPPFWGYRAVKDIKPEDFLKYFNKYTLFNNRWGYKKNDFTENEYNDLLRQAGKKFEEMTEYVLTGKILQPVVSYGYFRCRGEKNLLILENDNITIPFPRQKNEPHLCISDYFRSDSDILPLQIVTLGDAPAGLTKKLHDEGRFKDYFLYHGYFTEATEALAEYWHFKIRQELRLTTANEQNVESVLRQNYTGLRYSFGYPSCPDLEGNKILGKLLHMDKIGIFITDSLMMVPEFTTSAIIVCNKRAEYFTI